MEFKGTKSNWEIAGEDKTFVYALNEKGTNAFSLSINNDGRTSLSEQQSNALLISKAPEMLKLLQDIIKIKDLIAYPDHVEEKHSIEALAVGGMIQAVEKLIKEATEIQ